MTTPTTAAGRALSERMTGTPSWMARAILAIEAEAALTPAEPTLEYRFTQWDDTVLVVTVDDDDPGDMGEPRTLTDYDDGPTTYVSVRAANRYPPPAEPTLDVERLARALPQVMTQEECDEVYAVGTNPLDVPYEWFTTPRELATDILSALEEPTP